MSAISPSDRIAMLALVVAVSVTTSLLLRPGAGGEAGGADLRARVAALEADPQTPSAPSSDRAVERRLAALEAEIARLRDAAAAPRAAEAGSGAGAAVEASGPPPQTELHDTLGVGLATDAASVEHAAAVARLAEHLVRSAGPPRNEIELAWATRALQREAVRDRISPDEAAALEPVLNALPTGHAARTPLAQAIAIGWSGDARMDGFLSRFATNREPAVHQGVLAILDDEHPSDAFSEYVIRIVREERDPAVLGIALGLDRIEAAATAAVAPRLVDVIATRIHDGGLDAEMRARAGLAVAVASLRAPDLGVTTLRRLADEEPDTELQTLLREAASQLVTGDATLKSLERLFD